MEEVECREPSQKHCADPVGAVFAANQNGTAVEDGAWQLYSGYSRGRGKSLAYTRVYLLQPLGQRLAFVLAVTPIFSLRVLPACC